MKSQHILIIVGVLVAGIFFYIGYWLYTHFERYSEIVEVGFQGKARDNPLLAAERLLERMGTTAETVPSLPDVEEDFSFHDILILSQYGRFLDQAQTEQLFSWIDGGGHLIMSSLSAADILGKMTKTESDPLLSELEVSRHQNGLDDSDRAKVPPTEFWWAQYHLQVAFNPEHSLKADSYEPAREISDQYGTHFLYYYYGSGLISVLSDLAFIENDQISDHDHAQFLWQLVHLEHTVAKVWLLRMQAESEGGAQDKIPPLSTLLWRNLWTMIIVAAILLLCWIWAATRRFGPLLPVLPRTRRRLLEHIEASGHFLWRQDQAHTLLHGARQAVLKRIESVHPDWTRLSPLELSQRLAQLAELPAYEEIQTALYGSKPDTEIAFTRILQILTKIRKTL